MEDKLTKEEQALFDSLSKHRMPPAELEEKVVNQLKERNMIKSATEQSPNNKRIWITRIAATFAFFILGYFVGNMNSGQTTEISSGYILLLHEDERFHPEGTEMEVFTEYATWMGKMILDGVQITGKELAPESTHWLRPEGYAVAEVQGDKISGYFIIDVEDRLTAERIARSSPHIKYGGTVELIKLSERN